MKNKYQTTILICNYDKVSVEFERRRKGSPAPAQVGTWYTRRNYTPTKTSLQRLQKTVNKWGKKGWAEINLCLPLVEIELTC